MIVTLAITATSIWSAWDYGGGYLRTQASAAAVVLLLLPVGCWISWADHREQTRERKSRLSSDYWRLIRPPSLVVLGCSVWLLAGLQCIVPNGGFGKWVGARMGYSDAAAVGARPERIGVPVGLLDEAKTSDAAFVQTLGERHTLPISVAPTYTRNSLVVPAMFAATVWLGAICLPRHRCLVWLLLGTVLAGGFFSFFGLADLMRLARDSEVELRQRLVISPVGAGDPFGPFVNNNTGAGYLNIAISCALGLLVIAVGDLSRSTRLAGRRRLDVLLDWRVAGCVMLTILLIAGVLGSQSRGGTLGMLAGLTVLGVGKARRGNVIGPLAVGIVLLAAAWFMLDHLGMQDRTEARLQTLADGASLGDPRIGHWKDGLRTATHYLVMGSGLGTYRFAYLPYQQFSQSAWFVNADGMHVEWLVEGGIWMLLIVAAGFVVVVRCLRRLPAAIKTMPPGRACDGRGLLTTMTYLLPAILVTQSFDFGILQPPLLLTFAALCGATVGIASAPSSAWMVRFFSRHRREADGARSLARGWSLTFCLLVFGVVISGLALATLDLRESAVVQRASLVHDRYINRYASDLPNFASTIERVQGVLDRSPDHSEAHLILARLYIAQQRRLGAIYLVQEHGLSPPEATRWVSQRNVRRAYYQADNASRLGIEGLMLPTQDLEIWSAARHHAMAALMLCPLDDRPRLMLIELDMVRERTETDRGATEELLASMDDVTPMLVEQAAILRKRNRQSLRQLEQLAEVYPGGSSLEFVQKLQLDLDYLN